MQIKFVGLIFLILASLVITTFGFGGGFDGGFNGGSNGGFGGDVGCQCWGRHRWTRICCDESGGFLQYGQCYQGRSRRFLRCCQFQGVSGSCST